MMQKMKSMAQILIDAYNNNLSDDWEWFENALTYDNAILPLSLFHVVELTGDEATQEIATKTTKFLEKNVIHHIFLNLVLVVLPGIRLLQVFLYQ